MSRSNRWKGVEEADVDLGGGDHIYIYLYIDMRVCVCAFDLCSGMSCYTLQKVMGIAPAMHHTPESLSGIQRQPDPAAITKATHISS